MQAGGRFVPPPAGGRGLGGGWNEPVADHRDHSVRFASTLSAPPPWAAARLSRRRRGEDRPAGGVRIAMFHNLESA